MVVVKMLFDCLLNREREEEKAQDGRYSLHPISSRYVPNLSWSLP